MLSTAAVYALRAMACLAEHPGESLTGRQIAREADISSEYLAKVMGILAKHGLINSRRGRRGGFRLVKPAEKITLLDIIRATSAWEPLEAGPAAQTGDCDANGGLMALVSQAVAEIESRLDGISLAEAVRKADDR